MPTMVVLLQQKLPVAMGNSGRDYGHCIACGLGTVILEVSAMVIILVLKCHMACYLTCTGPIWDGNFSQILEVLGGPWCDAFATFLVAVIPVFRRQYGKIPTFDFMML